MQKSFFNLKIFALKIYLCVSIHLALQVVTERQNYKVCKTPVRLEKVFLFLFGLSRLTIISDIIYNKTADVCFTWRTETIFLVLLQWLTLVTSLTVVSTGRTVVQETNREETSSSNCPPTASGRWSPLSMLSKHWNKINNELCTGMYLLNDHEQMNGRNDRQMDKQTRWFLKSP